MKTILNIAHRGASAHQPENTIAAFNKALQMQADAIELDVRMTRDKEIVVFHDARMKDGTWIKDQSAESIKRKAGRNGMEVPLLDEVLRHLDNRITLNIEIKSPGMIDLLLNKIHMYDTSKIIVSSSLHRCLYQLHRKAPQIMTGALTRRRLFHPLRILNELKAGLIIQHFGFIDKNLVDHLHKREKKIFVWTVNGKQNLRRMIRMKVDGIITDYPDKLRALLIQPEQFPAGC